MKYVHKEVQRHKEVQLKRVQYQTGHRLCTGVLFCKERQRTPDVLSGAPSVQTYRERRNAVTGLVFLLSVLSGIPTEKADM